MKSKLLLLAGACTLALTGVAHAADNTMTVTASINGACGFVLPTSTLAFGVLDPTSSADATGTASVDYWCTTGTVASTTAGNGANWDGSVRRMKDGTNYVPYSLAVAGGTGTGAGKSNPLTMTVTGTVANGNYINAAVGAYVDTVTLTVTP